MKKQPGVSLNIDYKALAKWESGDLFVRKSSIENGTVKFNDIRMIKSTSETGKWVTNKIMVDPIGLIVSHQYDQTTHTDCHSADEAMKQYVKHNYEVVKVEIKNITLDISIV